MDPRETVDYLTRRAGGLVRDPVRTAVAIVSGAAGVAFSVAHGAVSGVTSVSEAWRHRDRDTTATDPMTRAREALIDEAPAGPAAAQADAPAPSATAESELEPDADVVTQAGIPAAEPGYNPATGLEDRELVQPDTEPLIDPGTAKSVRSEAATMRKAAETDPSKKD